MKRYLPLTCLTDEQGRRQSSYKVREKTLEGHFNVFTAEIEERKINKLLGRLL